MSNRTTERKSLSTLERTFEIVEYVKDADGARVSEVANSLEMPKSTAYNHLSTLEQQEYLVREGDEYHISLKFLDIGGYAANRKRAYRESIPKTKELARESKERAQFIVEENTYGIVIQGYLGESAVQTDVRIGRHLHLHTMAAGKAILAHQPDDHVSEIFDRHGLPARTEQTITDRDEMLVELETVRDRGFAFNKEERISGQNAVGAPLILNGRVLGAFSVSGPTNRMKGEWFETDLPDLLLGVVNELELNLNYS